MDISSLTLRTWVDSIPAQWLKAGRGLRPTRYVGSGEGWKAGTRTDTIVHRTLRRLPVLVAAGLLISGLGTGVAHATVGPNCVTTSLGDTICISVPSSTLFSYTWVTVTDSPSTTHDLQITWTPNSGGCLPGVAAGACPAVEDTATSPWATDYSFMWPTQKYLDRTGTLSAQVAGTTTSVSLSGLTLSNGNTIDIQHSSFIDTWTAPKPWTSSTDPTFAASGDGADNKNNGQSIASSIAATNPPLFLYLGDVYENGTYSEMLNHYGWNAMDGPCPFSPSSRCGNSWGKLATITQPTIGNHEYVAPPKDGSPWVDYWHQRPLFTSFTFAKTLFLDLNCGPLPASSCAVGPGSAQYNLVNNLLSGSHPPCVIAYWHIPVLNPDSTVRASTALKQLWSLLVDKGVSLVLNGHVHSSAESVPLNDQAVPATTGQASTRMLIEGSGGSSLTTNITGPAWAWHVMTKTYGALYLKLNGAQNSGTPTSITWNFEDKNHSVLQPNKVTNTAQCGPPPPAPTVTGFTPQQGPVGTSVDVTGTSFTTASAVKFGGSSGTPATTLKVNSDTDITATVPNGAASGQICVTNSTGTGCSSGAFTVTVSGVSLVQSAGNWGAATTTPSASWPAATSAGDTLVAAVTFGGGPTITPPAGWTLREHSTSGMASIYDCVHCASESGALTWTLSTAQIFVINLYELSPATFDSGASHTTGSGTSTTIDTGATGSLASGDAVIAQTEDGGAEVPSVGPAGYTEGTSHTFASIWATGWSATNESGVQEIQLTIPTAATTRGAIAGYAAG